MSKAKLLIVGVKKKTTPHLYFDEDLSDNCVADAPPMVEDNCVADPPPMVDDNNVYNASSLR